MHVAICSDGIFPASMGGIERHTRLLIESLARRSERIRLTVIHTHEGQSFFSHLPRVEERWVAPKPGRRQYLLECIDMSARFADVLRTLPDALIYSQGVCVVRHTREFSHRLIINPHGLESFQTITLTDWAKTAPFRIVQRHTFRHAKRLVSLGGRLTEILGRESGDPTKVAVIPNGVMIPDRFEREARPDSAPLRLLFVGRLAPNKGLPDLLRALEELDRRGLRGKFELDVVGGGPLLDKLKATNARSDVRLHGKVDDSALEARYAYADALVLPTRFEGMPTVVLEAMARALPVLVTDVGATRELVDESNGEIIPKRDPRGLAGALERLRNLGAQGRRALGEAGARRAAQRFTWERVADMHLDLFARAGA